MWITIKILNMNTLPMFAKEKTSIHFFLLISSFCFLFVFIIIIIIIIIIIHFCCNSEPTHRRLEFFPRIRNYDIL